jgi:GGDEF domain-containing protein
VRAGDQVGDGVSAELAAFLRNAADGRPVRLVPCVCGECGGRVFFVLVDDVEGGAERVCAGCGGRAFIADSEEFWADADPGEACCPCGSEEFETAVAFSLADDGSVRWVTVGLRCLKDGAAGIYADWKIDYGPTDHLLTMV